MNQLKDIDRTFKFTDLINSLSLLVSLGAAICLSFVYHIYKIPVDLPVVICMAIIIYVIYALDHLLDGHKLKHKSRAIRHAFHFTYRFPIIVASSIFLVVAIWIVATYLDVQAIRLGLVLGALTLIHFIINHLIWGDRDSRFFLKEVMIAFVVALAISWFPKPFKLGLLQLGIFGLFFLINLGNLLIFSAYDYHRDKENKMKSMAVVFGKKATLRLSQILLIIAIVWALIMGVLGILDSYVAIVFVAMIVLLLVITLVPKTFAKHDRYRFWGDLIYIIPLIYLLFQY